MAETVNEVTLILRRWDQDSGLTEHQQVYPSLDSLFGACLNVNSPDLIDRVIIRGRDNNGAERVLTFVFQSVTVDSAG